MHRVWCHDFADNCIGQSRSLRAGAQILPSILQERREFESQLASGAVFEPSEHELKSARQPPEFSSNVICKLEPDYYADGDIHSVREAIDVATTQSEGNIFLVCDSGSRLNLSFNDKYAVCEYQNDESDEYLYFDCVFQIVSCFFRGGKRLRFFQ